MEKAAMGILITRDAQTARRNWRGIRVYSGCGVDTVGYE
jgi:hypothetical protein